MQPAGLLARRVLHALLLAWAVVTISFVLLELAPGDTADVLLPPGTPAELREDFRDQWGLDRPAWERYALVVGNLVRLDLGTSTSRTGRPVRDLLAERIPRTLLLAGSALLITLLAGYALGLSQALRPKSRWDRLGGAVLLVLYAAPAFWIGFLLLWALGLGAGFFPISGIGSATVFEPTGVERFLDRLHHLVLPALTLALANLALVARHVRASFLEVLAQDYVRTARALGLPERRVVGIHAARNALAPFFTLVGLSLPFLFSGSVVVEHLFAWEGMGRLLYDAAMAQDAPLVLGAFCVYAFVVAGANWAADLACAWADPRLREGGVR